ESFQDYTTAEFPGKVIYKIIPENDYLWLSGSKGLMKFQPEQKTLHVFNKFDGLQDNQFSPNAGVRMKDGTIFFGGINGFNGFRPSDMIQNNQTPTLVFTNFSLFNKKVIPKEDGSPLQNSITYTDRLVLDKAHSIFHIEFAALSYTGAHKNRYKYMLEGFESEWTETNDPGVTYTNLPAGNYTFRVKASNGDGIWNNAGIAMPIKVLPPVWLSYPFIVGYILLFVSLIIIYFQYLKTIHKKEIAYLSVEKEKEIYSTKINFFTHIVHEIRTPLTLILGPLKNIMSTKGEITEVMPQLELIERNGSRLLSLANQLMDFQKVEDGGMSVITQECCINDQLEDVYKRFRLSAELKNIAFRIQLPDQKLYALLDEEAFNKIVSNLLSNALKFTGNSIDLQLTADSKYAVISVSDNGPGIDKNEQDNIFKPFYQIKESRPSDYIGTGIGLLVVKRLVEMQNGEIKVESEPGEGSVFRVRFPLFHPQTEQADTIESVLTEVSDSEPMQVLKTKPSVLLVDDNRDLLTFLSDTLSADYDIQCCMDGNEAIEYLKNQSADLIISDVMMPNMDGFELCALLKSNILTSHIPVLLLTAKVGTEDRIQGLDNGADVYIEKPFSTNVLKAQINSLLRNRERIRRSFREESSSSLTVIANTKVDEEFLQKIHQFIEENISDTQLSVDMIARLVGMGRSNFFLKVKSLSEMTPNELIRIIRLKKAKSLFDSGETCVSDICFRVGFSSPSYFGKCFMQEYGVTPSEYIKTIKDRSEYA
ncbi:MAG: hybrid sensor histidine kinase/response regulator transcription factor, partial [Bacteroidales bacterium]